jgi:hypothetical protein
MVGRSSRYGVAAAVMTMMWTMALAVPAARAQTAADLHGARERYAAAEAAMKEGRFEDARRDYEAAHALSRDPALLFKIGRAHEGAGTCEVAVAYYVRYLCEGAPATQFVATTEARIAACGGEPRAPGARSCPVPDRPAARDPGPATPPSPPSTPPSDAASARADAAPGSADAASASAASPPGARALSPSHSHKAAWVLTGSGIALLAIGSVLAYATDAAENDIRDLYTGFSGQPFAFDAQTRRRYDELIDDGERFQRLSWTAFGLAGAAAASAAILFVVGRRDEGPPPIAPVVTTTSAGVSLRF